MSADTITPPVKRGRHEGAPLRDASLLVLAWVQEKGEAGAITRELVNVVRLLEPLRDWEQAQGVSETLRRQGWLRCETRSWNNGRRRTFFLADKTMRPDDAARAAALMHQVDGTGPVVPPRPVRQLWAPPAQKRPKRPKAVQAPPPAPEPEDEPWPQRRTLPAHGAPRPDVPLHLRSVFDIAQEDGR